ncbi:MAG: type I-E CRISPR-associated protein Cse1/CasA [Lentisphaerae bacterium]|nr:type I-E CRISPR-associated protein Cse1/CasA [Lentisphaerota bacterium]
METTEFNLLDEPWIRILDANNNAKEVSLTTALLEAHNISDLGGELPTQDVAVLRFILAVLHTVFSRVDESGEASPIDSPGAAMGRWKAIWDQKRFPQGPLKKYLESQKDRFWLFHPERPFGQVPEARIGTAYTASKLNGELSESNNKIRLFPLNTGEGKKSVSYSEAARWLLHVNGFDDTSGKAKVKGLPSPGAGWLGKLGLITAVGHNLFETLMLNLTLLQDGSKPWGENRPAWELDYPRSGERTEIPLPDNPAELLTLQSRRLLLNRENGAVTGYRLLGGDFFPKVNAFSEQMTVWSLVKDKAVKSQEYVPRRHISARQMWREFSTLFLEREGSHVPGVVKWISRLKQDRLIEKTRMISFRIASVQYGDKDFFVTDVFSDSLTFHAGLLSDLGSAWRLRIDDEVRRCSELADAVSRLSKNIDIAAGGKGTADNAGEQLYYRLDEPFREWLYTLDPENDGLDMEDKCLKWRKAAQQIAWNLGQELVEEAGTKAFVGREVTEKRQGKEITVHYSAPESFNWFLYNITKIYT